MIEVSIVTPDGKVYEHDANLLEVATQTGPIGIMLNHLPLIANLEIAETRVKYGDQEDRIAVNGGFIEFIDNKAMIVADSAENQSDIDVARAQSAKERSEAEIKKAKAKCDQQSLDRAQIALRRAINRINVAKIDKDQ